MNQQLRNRLVSALDGYQILLDRLAAHAPIREQISPLINEAKQLIGILEGSHATLEE